VCVSSDVFSLKVSFVAASDPIPRKLLGAEYAFDQPLRCCGHVWTANQHMQDG
jgi:hypothetical protein